MGIASATTVENKRAYASLIDSYQATELSKLTRSLTAFHSTDARFEVVQPLNELGSIDTFVDEVVEPMNSAFAHLHRRSDMMFGGEFEGEEWVVSHGHYVGEFVNAWMGIPPSQEIVWIHYIEFHQVQERKAVRTLLYLDMLDFLRQVGRWPIDKPMGYEGFVAGPATADGIVSAKSDSRESQKSLTMVDDMLSRLYTEDEAWRPYWHPNMYWYGPSGYGSYVGVDGFARFQLPYEGIFDPARVSSTYRRSGDATLDETVKGHFARFADGRYVASGGWPSHGGFMVNDWLDVPASGQMFTVRVADIWRRDGDLLVENWVFVDVIDMLQQLGVDAWRKAGIELDL